MKTGSGRTPSRPSGRRQGRILRVKEGYNPNSSSMGSIVFALPVALLGVTALFGAAAGVLFSALMRSRGKQVRDAQQPEPTGPEEKNEEDAGSGEASP